MNSECQIKDDDEIMEEEKTRYNFRRFTEEEIKNKNSPFERTKKKETPFLFQKKKGFQKEEFKISLEDIISKIDSLPLGPPYSPKTPPYYPTPISELEIKELNLTLQKNTNQTVVNNES